MTRPGIWVAVWLGLFGAAEGTSHAADGPPNIVLIISDDQAWGDFGFMGHRHIRTPHLDRLASQSLLFTRGYVPDSLCRPSLATIITGLYPHEHGIVGNDPAPPLNRGEALMDAPETRRPGLVAGQRPWTVRDNPAYDAKRRRLIRRIDDLPTLPRLLGRRGYLSHQSGKWWEGRYSRGGFTHGMTEGFGQHPQGRHGDEGLRIGRETMRPIFAFIEEARAEGRPFFIWYAPFLPHRPHNPPQRLLDHYRGRTDSIHTARYWAMCEWFDETCGRLLEYLDREGLADDTLVVFVVDNGWRQRPDGPGYGPRSKRSVYDGGLRTPVMLRLPGRIRPRRDEVTPVSSIDLAPTILAACGVRPTDAMSGVNLLDAEALSAREAIFGEVFAHDIADLDDPVASLKYRWCIEGRWKLILPHEPVTGPGAAELYDLLADPHERHDLASRHETVVARLSRRVERWWPIGAAE